MRGTAEVVEAKKTPSGKSAISRQAEYEVGITMAAVGLFGMIAVSTGHHHWAKTEEQVLPMTAPLIRMVNQLPKATLKRIENNWNPILFAIGCCAVVGPDIAKELTLRKEANADNQQASRRSFLKVVRSNSGEQAGADDNTISPTPKDALVNPV